MQEARINILSTRSLNSELLDVANAKGVRVECISFIDVLPIQSVEIQQEIELAYLQSALVIFTSMNAVEAVAAQQEEQQPDWKIYCIGNTTRQLAEKYFGEECIAGFANSAAELAEQIVEDYDGDEIIFFCGDQRREELPDILKKHQIDFNEIVVYETLQQPKRIQKKYHGILFFSPTAVKSFFEKNKAGEHTIFFAIGNTTANEIKKFTANKIIVADEPGKENLLNKALEYFT
ncbi:MAG: uroporphyrinogen-III synthase [Chitinophagaceae bacterium]